MLTSLYKTEAVNRIQQHRPYNQLASLNQSAIRPSLKSNGKGLQIMKILHISANNHPRYKKTKVKQIIWHTNFSIWM